MNRVAIVLLASTALLVSGCKKDAPADIPPPPRDVAAPAPPPRPATPPPPPARVGPAPGTQAHFSAAMNGADTIFFDFDRFNISDQSAAALRQQADYLRQHANAQATIEGHADERGTREYNLALGERRANAARDFLVSLGIAEGRLRTVSYGKDRPVALESNEAAWARNRRAVSIMVN